MNHEWVPSRIAEDQRGDKDQRTATDHLEHREPPLRAEETIANARDQNEFHCNDHQKSLTNHSNGCILEA
jgi:hypothetical protein